MSERLILGPPGCGKTHRLINIVKEQIQDGVNPERIAFVSFSKKSIEEARLRSSMELELPHDKVPWFRTLHSIGFRWLGMKTEEIVNRYDFNKIGIQLGMVFDNGTAAAMTDGLLPVSAKEGNKYLELIGRAKLRKISLEEQYNDSGNYNINWPMLVKVDEIYAKYKSDNMKYDFTDMISLFVQQGTAPSLDVLIVDEAQDLTPLQWDQVDVLRQSVSKVWYAGDDDQAVHRWMGVDVGLFMNACDDVEVLDQSYRVPNAAHALAQRVVSRIVDRHEKRWRPTDREGSVTYHRHWYDVDIDYGSWTIMARTNRIIQDVADSLRDSGYYFERNGRPSIDPMLLKGIDTWETLADSIAVSILAVRDLYKLVPKRGSNAVVKWGSSKSLEGIEEDTMLTYDDLVRNHGMLASKDTDPMSIVNMSLEERRYMNLILKRGEDITKPRIRLSTIHAMKGGEDDNVILFTESAYPCVETKFPDDEHRIFYTGITRTKENLHIIESGAKYRYEL